MSGDQIAQLLIANMTQLGELVRQGKLTQGQINQVPIPCPRLDPSPRYAAMILIFAALGASPRPIPSYASRPRAPGLPTILSSTAQNIRRQPQRSHSGGSSSSRLHLDRTRPGESPSHQQSPQLVA